MLLEYKLNVTGALLRRWNHAKDLHICHDYNTLANKCMMNREYPAVQITVAILVMPVQIVARSMILWDGLLLMFACLASVTESYRPLPLK